MKHEAGARFIFVTMLIDWLVVGMMSPVLPYLVIGFMHGNVQAASAFMSPLSLAFAVVQFFAAPILGLLSDRFGRRPIILLSCLGSAVDCAILALAPNLSWLFVGRLLSGGTAASATSSAAYIADVTPPEKRAAAFGMSTAAFGVGFALGPAIGGALASFGPRVPFFVAMALMLASAAYGFFVLPESLKPENRVTKMAWARANPLGSLRLVRRHRELLGFVTALFCSNMAVQTFSTLVLYTVYRFNWNDRDNGFALASFGVISIVSALVVGKLVARFGRRKIIVTGFSIGIVGFFVYALAPNGWVFSIALLLTGLWSMAGPPVQASISARVEPSEQGELQGAIGAMRSIAAIVGPTLFPLLFAFVTAKGVLVNAVWWCGALLLAGAVASSLYALRETPAEATAVPAAS